LLLKNADKTEKPVADAPENALITQGRLVRAYRWYMTNPSQLSKAQPVDSLKQEEIQAMQAAYEAWLKKLADNVLLPRKNYPSDMKRFSTKPVKRAIYYACTYEELQRRDCEDALAMTGLSRDAWAEYMPRHLR